MEQLNNTNTTAATLPSTALPQYQPEEAAVEKSNTANNAEIVSIEEAREGLGPDASTYDAFHEACPNGSSKRERTNGSPTETETGQPALPSTTPLIGSGVTSGPLRETMAGKPVLYRDAKTALTVKSVEFQHKLLCDGLTFNLADACAFLCVYCYVGPAMRKILFRLIREYNEAHGTQLEHKDFVIRRRHSLKLLAKQLKRANGTAKFSDPSDDRVVYSSTLVDVAANVEILRETAAACILILETTHWQIRLLSKSNLLYKLIADRMIPEKYHHRFILGFSTGTLDNRVAKAIESGTPLVSKRLEALHWLQDRGLRTFGMICPSLPQTDYRKFSRETCEAIRVEKCEHVWAEVINVRGKSFTHTLAALYTAGLNDEAMGLSSVAGPGAGQRWEDYARQTFLAHTENVPAEKLRFIQYVKPQTADWWAQMRDQGAVLLDSTAKKRGLITTATRTTPIVVPIPE